MSVKRKVTVPVGRGLGVGERGAVKIMFASLIVKRYARSKVVCQGMLSESKLYPVHLVGNT